MENDNELKPMRMILLAFVIAVIIKVFVFDLMIAKGDSMEPSISDGSLLVVMKVYYGVKLPWSKQYFLRWAYPKEGDIVVFYTPEGEIAVKRCVEILDGNTFIALGDNSLQSLDSRSYGEIPLDNIIGKVLGRT